MGKWNLWLSMCGGMWSSLMMQLSAMLVGGNTCHSINLLIMTLKSEAEINHLIRKNSWWFPLPKKVSSLPPHKFAFLVWLQYSSGKFDFLIYTMENLWLNHTFLFGGFKHFLISYIRQLSLRVPGIHTRLATSFLVEASKKTGSNSWIDIWWIANEILRDSACTTRSAR